MVVVGLAALGFCWYGVSGKATLDNQTPWLSGAVLAYAVCDVGIVLWLVAGFRAVRRGQRQVVFDTRSALGLSAVLAQGPTAEQAEVAAATLVTAPGMMRFHRPECPLVRGKSVRAMSPADASSADLATCGVCES
ncbi:hypothetical protein [Sporichthya sp.]|uniref:hypothetical protein n=1 Tax=Sporichthya sp. TaxID=65475 RepID=UPI0017EE91D6|nr:hypothetical protein [Sporichthya sp.]MBA3741836.1 hypothetical protein [Sporichthya sp.]